MTPATDHAATTTEAPPRRRGTVSLLIFRSGAGALVVLVLFQAAMAGQFLSGNATALTMHEIGAHTTWTVSIIVAIAALVAWRRGRLPGWVALIGGPALPVVFYLQEVAGYVRALSVHVPLGVGLLGLSLVLLWAGLRGKEAT
jgi:hypothetical protein